MESSLFHSIWTVVALSTFVLIGIWAYSSRNRERFNEAARMPLDDDPAAGDAKQEKNNG